MSPFNAGNRSGTRAVIDVQAALKRMGGDKSLLSQVAIFFLEDSVPLVTKIQEGLAHRDVNEILRAAHGLKGMASNFDALALQQFCSELEELARRNELDGMQTLFDNLEREMEQVCQALRSELCIP